MKATAKDLRFHSKKLTETVKRGVVVPQQSSMAFLC